MSLAFVPVYIHYMGIEAYGLIGVFVVLQTWLSLLDFGMAPVLSREMSRFRVGAADLGTVRDLLRGAEIVLGAAAGLAALAIWAASPWLAMHWLQATQIPLATVSSAIALMGLVAGARCLEGVYRGAAAGLDMHVAMNIIASAMATLRGAGAVGVLVWVSPSITAFFVWQLVVSAATTVLFLVLVRSKIPPLPDQRFSMKTLIRTRRFAGGMMGISASAIVLTQLDKVLLSKMLSLQDFGYYSLSSVVAGALLLIAMPISQSYFPRFSELVARNDRVELSRVFHQGAQLIAAFVGSAAIALIAFAEMILYVWTGDTHLSRTSAPLLRVLALGTLLNALMWIPYQAQIAHGLTRLALLTNVVAILVIAPAIVWAVQRWGAIGGAWAWVALNIGYLLISAHFMYVRILATEKRAWYRDDVLIPLIPTALVALTLSQALPVGAARLGQGIALAMCCAALLATSTMFTSVLRLRLVQWFNRSRPA